MSYYIIIGLGIALGIFALVYYNAKNCIEWQDEHQYSQFNDSDHWYGSFYINKQDKRIFLQKKRAGGYTLNLGHPTGIIFMLVIVSLLAWIIYIGS